MNFQTRSNDGALNYFSTLKEALDFANSKNRVILELGDPTYIPTQEQLAPCVWKISFALVTGERVRLIWEDQNWVFRQMDDEVAEMLKVRGLTANSW